MVRTGANPQEVVEMAELKAQLLSTAGKAIINSSPVLKGAQIVANAAARSGSFETVKEIAKAKMKQGQ